MKKTITTAAKTLKNNIFSIIAFFIFLFAIVLVFCWLFTEARADNLTVLVAPVFLSAIGIIYTNKARDEATRKHERITRLKGMYEEMLALCYAKAEAYDSKAIAKLNGKVYLNCGENIINNWSEIQSLLYRRYYKYVIEDEPANTDRNLDETTKTIKKLRKELIDLMQKNLEFESL